MDLQDDLASGPRITVGGKANKAADGFIMAALRTDPSAERLRNRASRDQECTAEGRGWVFHVLALPPVLTSITRSDFQS